MDRLLYKEADGDITCRSRDFDKVFPTLYAYEETGLTPDEIVKLKAGKETVISDMRKAAEVTELIEELRADAKLWLKGEWPSNATLPSMAADALEALQNELQSVKAERDYMKATLIKIGACTLCKHRECDAETEEPCYSCMEGKNYDKWELRESKSE